MIGKIHWLLLLVALCIAGCGKPSAESAAAGKEQSPQAGNARKEDKLPAGVLKTPDMPEYHWPADFELPLIINIPLPEVLPGIENPSPPIVEEENTPPVEEENKSPIEVEKE